MGFLPFPVPCSSWYVFIFIFAINYLTGCEKKWLQQHDYQEFAYAVTTRGNFEFLLR